MDPDKLKVAEHFFSIQGEGKTVGVASVFLRLSGCVLNCKWCDTVEVWKKGTTMTLIELQDLFYQQGYVNRLKTGAHLIVTGGDPLIQQEGFFRFIKTMLPPCYVEVETEGVLFPDEFLRDVVTHYNVSPKLANSGMPEYKRLKYDTLGFHVGRPQDIFKFPVATIDDACEAIDLCEKVGMPRSRVYFMPICNDKKSHEEVGPRVVEYAKTFHVNYSPRLHLLLWDKATGV
jgi:7-carboxy-7-deazaguanine synthase